MSVGVPDSFEFDFSAMFDRVDHPAIGRKGGGEGAPTFVRQDDDTPMRGKGRQVVPRGKIVELGFPGGAGYGNPSDRDLAAVKRDLALDYISVETAKNVYGLSDQNIEEVMDLVSSGADF